MRSQLRDGTFRLVPDLNTVLSAPLSDDDYDDLAALLEEHSPFDIDGVLGALHAIAVAPSMLTPSAWLSELAPKGFGDDRSRAAHFAGLLLRLHNEVLDAVDRRAVMVPEIDDIAGCESFARGYTALAAIDAAWIGDDDRWTFAAPFAHLADRSDLVPHAMVPKFEAVPDSKGLTRRSMDSIIVSTHDSFRRARQAALAEATASTRGTVRPGRNEPCPCGSGKKYKRCCIDQRVTPPRH